MGESAIAELAKASLLTAAARKGGSVTGVIFHSDQGSTYTADEFEKACSQLRVARSMGRVGSSLDNAPAEIVLLHIEDRVHQPTHIRHQRGGPPQNRSLDR